MGISGNMSFLSAEVLSLFSLMVAGMGRVSAALEVSEINTLAIRALQLGPLIFSVSP